MRINTFWNYIEQIHSTSKSTTKKELLREIFEDYSEDSWKASFSIIAGEEFDSVGVAPTTMKNAITDSKLPITKSEIDDLEYETGSVTEGLLRKYPFEFSSNPVSFKSEDETTLNEFATEEVNSQEYQKLVHLYNDCQQLESLSGNNLQAKVSSMLQKYYPPAVSFAILNDLSLGAGKKTLINAVAEQEYTKDEIQRARAFVTGPIEFIELMNSEGGLPYDITPGEPFEPMLAKDDTIENTTDWLAQLKLDGSRILIHITKDGNAVGYTRKPRDVTFSLPELSQIEWPEGEYVFDCEAVAYDSERGHLPFSYTTSRIGRKHNIQEFDYNIRFYLFDLLVSEGEDITDEPLESRLDKLHNLSWSTTELVTVVKTYDNVDEIIEVAKNEGYEGAILKKKGSPYTLGKRSSDWVKEKVTQNTIDLKITSFEKQQGEDSNTLGSLGLETSDGVFVGSVGTGWDDELGKQIWNNQDEFYNKIVEIRFEGFDEKLRFPSFQYIREDGSADSLEKVKKLSTEV